MIDPSASEAVGADALVDTLAALDGEQLFGAVRSIRILAGRSFASKARPEVLSGGFIWLVP
jgi:hypothetical protein